MNVVWRQEANGYRLPTEAEWEYCARAGEYVVYAGSDDIDEVGWYHENSDNTTHPVGEKKANAFGLYDMNGNVWEWCWDKMDAGAYKKRTEFVDPVVDWDRSPFRIRRGGAWNQCLPPPTAIRRADYPKTRENSIGFRFLRTI